MFEDLLGGGGALRTVTPADGERVALVKDSLARDTGRDRRLQQFGDLGKGRGKIHAAESRVDADTPAAVGEQTQGAVEGMLVEGNARVAERGRGVLERLDQQ